MLPVLLIASHEALQGRLLDLTLRSGHNADSTDAGLSGSVNGFCVLVSEVKGGVRDAAAVDFDVSEHHARVPGGAELRELLLGDSLSNGLPHCAISGTDFQAKVSVKLQRLGHVVTVHALIGSVDVDRVGGNADTELAAVVHSDLALGSGNVTSHIE